MILALSGLAGSGKSTAAAYLAERHGFARVRFAGPLKAMVRAFLAEAGTPAGEIERLIEGDRKQAPARELGGRTPRHFMQRLGTEFGRDLIHPELWAAAWSAGASAALAGGAPGVVAEDLRFPNEASAVLALGGRIAHLERPTGALGVEAHASEGQSLPWDALIRNYGAPEAMWGQLDALVLPPARVFA